MHRFKLYFEITNIYLFDIFHYKYKIEFIDIQQLYKNVL